MGVKKITDHVYAVGVLNPTLRKFDIVMETKFGTSYNAYLVMGEKKALIETVHIKFFDEYLENIRSLIDIKEIDYLIMNHNEPDHSGSIRMLLEENPNLTIVSSQGGKRFISQILNTEFNSKVVKDGDILSLGDLELKFINAPFLHWPDTMFTYLPQDKVLFPCDFLGAHYCEPRYLNTFVDDEKYEEAFQYYYDCIMGPFKPYVLQGLDKISELDIQVVCPSHGAVLVEKIDQYKEKYREWSTPSADREKFIFIPYASCYGFSRELAEAAAEQAKDCGISSVLYDISDQDMDQAGIYFLEASAVLVCSCTINQDAPPVVWDLLSRVCPIVQKGKPVGACGSYGWSGEAVGMIRERLKSLKLNFIGEGVRVVFRPDDQDIQSVKAYVKEIVEAIQ